MVVVGARDIISSAVWPWLLLVLMILYRNEQGHGCGIILKVPITPRVCD